MKFKKTAILASTLLLSATLVACGSDESSEGMKDTKTEAKSNESTDNNKSKNKEDQPNLIGYSKLLAQDVPLITNETLQLQKKSYLYIQNNESLFSGKKQSDIAKLKSQEDASITSKHLNKNAIPYLEKIVSFQGEVISVEENTDRDEPFSYVHVYDEAGQSYSYLTYQTTGDILEGDWVQFWGTPLGKYSFENVSGGFTNAIVIFGGTIEKVQ